MGILDKLLGGEDFPALPEDSPAVPRLRKDIKGLEELAGMVGKERLEIVPGDDMSYVFIGKPPKEFGLAWIEGEKVGNLKLLAGEKGISPSDMQKAVGRIRSAYENARDAGRHTTKIANRKVVVTAWKDLSREVGHVVRELST
jgi:hypothetical protein